MSKLVGARIKPRGSRVWKLVGLACAAACWNLATWEPNRRAHTKVAA